MLYRNIFVIYALLNDLLDMLLTFSLGNCLLLAENTYKMDRIVLIYINNLGNLLQNDIVHTLDRLFMIDFFLGSLSIVILRLFHQVCHRSLWFRRKVSLGLD